MEDIKNRRKIQDENELLKEEFDTQLGKLASLYVDGRLVLNKITIQKSSLYLNPETYLEAMKVKTKPSEVDIKNAKRFKRVKETQNMMKSLKENIEVDYDDKSLASKNTKNAIFVSDGFKGNIYEESKAIFESDIDDFLEINKRDRASIINAKQKIKTLKENFRNIHNNRLFSDSNSSDRKDNTEIDFGNSIMMDPSFKLRGAMSPQNENTLKDIDEFVSSGADQSNMMDPSQTAFMIKNMFNNKGTKNEGLHDHYSTNHHLLPFKILTKGKKIFV